MRPVRQGQATDDPFAVETCTKRRPWNPDEDEQLKQLVEVHGVKNWALIATQLHMRNGKQCRERWRNHLRPELNKGDWDMHEDVEIWDRVQEMGTKWAQISETYMPNRTDNDIKNRWNSIIRKQHHPSGRPWRPAENAAREQVLGATRMQQRRNGGGSSGGGGTKRKAAGSSGEEVQAIEFECDEELDDEEADLLRTAAEGDSPIRLRKLFGSPEAPETPAGALGGMGSGPLVGAARAAAHRGASTSTLPSREAIEEAAKVVEAAGLLGAEITADQFDADAYLLEAVGFSPDSKFNSPVRAHPPPARPDARANPTLSYQSRRWARACARPAAPRAINGSTPTSRSPSRRCSPPRCATRFARCAASEQPTAGGPPSLLAAAIA